MSYPNYEGKAAYLRLARFSLSAFLCPHFSFFADSFVSGSAEYYIVHSLFSFFYSLIIVQ